jgi:hypothetical protein
MYYTLAAVWGAGQGALIANLLAVVYDCCGGDQLTMLFGLLLCAEGIGGLIGAPLCGKHAQQVVACLGKVCSAGGGGWREQQQQSKSRQA